MPVALKRYDGMIHGFVGQAGEFDVGKQAVLDAAAALRARSPKRLRGESSGPSSLARRCAGDPPAPGRAAASAANGIRQSSGDARGIMVRGGRGAGTGGAGTRFDRFCQNQ